ncbi:MAG: pilus assembly protein PilZ [Candidatus Nitrosoglobus sp.]
MHLAEPNHRALAILLAGICLVALVVIALEVRYPPRFEQELGEVRTSVNSTNAVPARKKTAKQIALLPLGNYEEISMRPLFRSNRRPPDPEETESKEQQALREREAQQLKSHVKDLFAVNGIVVTDKKAVALLQDIKNNKSLRVSEGEKLEDWDIKQIFPDSVLFSNNGRAEALNLIRSFEPLKPNLPSQRPLPTGRAIAR